MLELTRAAASTTGRSHVSSRGSCGSELSPAADSAGRPVSDGSIDQSPPMDAPPLAPPRHARVAMRMLVLRACGGQALVLAAPSSRPRTNLHQAASPPPAQISECTRRRPIDGGARSANHSDDAAVRPATAPAAAYSARCEQPRAYEQS